MEEEARRIKRIDALRRGMFFLFFFFPQSFYIVLFTAIRAGQACKIHGRHLFLTCEFCLLVISNVGVGATAASAWTA